MDTMQHRGDIESESAAEIRHRQIRDSIERLDRDTVLRAVAIALPVEDVQKAAGANEQSQLVGHLVETLREHFAGMGYSLAEATDLAHRVLEEVCRPLPGVEAGQA